MSKKNDADRYRVFSRRAAIVGATKIGLMGVLGTRLAWLQIFENEKYKTLSDQNRISMKVLGPSRGQILDRFGVPLAINNQNFRAFVISEQTPDMEKTLDDFSKLIFLTEDEKAEIMAVSGRVRKFSPVMVKENLTWDQMAIIEARLPDLPGIFVDVGELRYYPLGNVLAHTVGYVGLVNRAEMTDDPIMTLPGFRIGKEGVEKSYDETLRGKAGQSQIEVNFIGREIRELNRVEPEDGDRLELTIDAELQIFCHERLSKEKSAAAVIMDAHTGAVYASSSNPDFDPNDFTLGISAEKWEELIANPAKPFVNKAISGQYPPGSTFKMITALAALENGDIRTTHSVNCPGYAEVGRDKFYCWKHSGHGQMDVIQALEQSCDTFFYEICQKTGIEKIAEMARKFGLGERLDFDIPGESPGLIPTKNWKLGRFGEKWQVGETVVASIGQGHVSSTMLQLATMTARLVNGGYAVKPNIVKNKIDPQQKWPKIDVKTKHLDLMIKGMNAVTSWKKGTAKDAQIQEKGYSMGGKTGTSQVRRITRAQRAEGWDKDNIPWKYRDHALFVGYGPMTDPRYVCAVIVEHGGSGSAAAAPLARDLLLETQKRDPAKKREG